VVSGTSDSGWPCPRNQTPEHRIVSSANLPAFFGRSVWTSVRPGTQAESVLPPFAADAGVPEVEQHGEQIVGLVNIAAPRLAVERDLGTRKDVWSIPCRDAVAAAQPRPRALIDLWPH